VEVALSAERRKLRWWSGRLTDVFRLEHPSCEVDPTITRLRPFEIERQPWLRPLYERAGGYAWDLLAWETQTTGRFGILRLIAAFPAPPDQRPRVFCPDGPPAPDHRYDAFELCLYYPDDPPERCWTLDQGLLGLFDMGSAHVAAEDLRRVDDRPWAIDEAPHGYTAPAVADPSLRLAPLGERL
jgi:hypothetical protein